jgi:hypothetical protein
MPSYTQALALKKPILVRCLGSKYSTSFSLLGCLLRSSDRGQVVFHCVCGWLALTTQGIFNYVTTGAFTPVGPLFAPVVKQDFKMTWAPSFDH